MQYNLPEYSFSPQRGISVSIMHLGRLGIRSSERLAQHQLKAARLVLEGNRRQVQQLLEAPASWSLLAEQQRLAVELGVQLLEHALETLEILVDTRDALSSWLKEETNTATATRILYGWLPISPLASAK